MDYRLGPRKQAPHTHTTPHTHTHGFFDLLLFAYLLRALQLTLGICGFCTTISAFPECSKLVCHFYDYVTTAGLPEGCCAEVVNKPALSPVPECLLVAPKLCYYLLMRGIVWSRKPQIWGAPEISLTNIITPGELNWDYNSAL